LGAFLSDRPIKQIQPSIVPKVRDTSWAQNVFTAWEKRGAAKPVMRAINNA
jgi:hypothetical protein